MGRLAWSVPVLGALVAALAAPAMAQPAETIGARALGMAGAFVAVADDASAAYWNPAGLAAGNFFGFAADLNWQKSPRGDAAPGVGTRSLPGTFIGVVTPPLGFSYVRLNEAGVSADPSPEAASDGLLPIIRLDTHQVGVTLLHTVGGGLTAGATLKYVRGVVGTGTIAATASADAVRDAAAHLDGDGSNAFNLDVGAHFARGPFSAGLLARNLTRPAFPAPTGDDAYLDPQVRLGVALRPGEPWVVSLDADLLVAESPTGRWRRAAVGVERWWGQRKVAVRGGARISTIDAARPVGAVGASFAVRSRLWLEAYVAAGAEQAERALGGSVRFAY